MFLLLTLEKLLFAGKGYCLKAKGKFHGSGNNQNQTPSQNLEVIVFEIKKKIFLDENDLEKVTLDMSNVERYLGTNKYYKNNIVLPDWVRTLQINLYPK